MRGITPLLLASALLLPCLAISAPLGDADAGIKGTLIKADINVTWPSARAKLIEQWRGLVDTLTNTQPHSKFIKEHSVRVTFRDLDRKWGTFDRDQNAAVFNDKAYKNCWRELLDQGLGADSATKLLALKSLAGFAHVIRDEMMNDDLVSHGFVYTGGWLEDEVLHFKEQAATMAEIASLHREFSTHRISLDEDQDIVFKTASDGNAALAAMIRRLYDGMPSMFYNRKPAPYLSDAAEQNIKDNRYDKEDAERQLKDCRESAMKGVEPRYTEMVRDPVQIGIPRISGGNGWHSEYRPCPTNWKTALPTRIEIDAKRLEFLQDPKRMDALRQYYRGLLAAENISPESLKEPDPR